MLTISTGTSSANCASRGSRIRLSPVRACVECGAPIDPIQEATTAAVCGRLPCVVSARTKQAAEQSALDEERVGRGRAVLEAAGERPDEVRWSLVPENRAQPTPLPPGAIDDFLLHLRRTVAEATTGVVHTDRHRPTPYHASDHPLAADRPFDPPTRNEARAFARACTACRGWCCRRGGTHAFLDAASIRRILTREGLDAGALEERYRSRVRETHLEGGCLFQGPDGCRLPRTLRSDTCNTWLCEDLTAAQDEWREHGGPTADHHFVPVTRRQSGQSLSP